MKTKIFIILFIIVFSVAFASADNLRPNPNFTLEKGGNLIKIRFGPEVYHVRFSGKGYGFGLIEYTIGDDSSRKIYYNVLSEGLDFLGYRIFYEKIGPEKEQLVFFRK